MNAPIPNVTLETILSWFHEWNRVSNKDDVIKINEQVKLRAKLMIEQPTLCGFLTMLSAAKFENNTEVGLYVASVMWELLNRQYSSTLLDTAVKL